MTKQKPDEILSRVYDQVEVVNGEVASPQQATLFPYLEFKGKKLYCLEKECMTGEIWTHLLAPNIYQQDAMYITHSIPCSEHLGK